MSSSPCSTPMGCHWLKSQSGKFKFMVGSPNKDGAEVVPGVLGLTPSGFDPGQHGLWGCTLLCRLAVGERSLGKTE